MKTKQSVQSDKLKKNMQYVNGVLFAMTAFFTLACYQFSNVIPNKLLLISVYIVALTGLGLFIYGFWLSKNIKSSKPAAIFSSVYILLVSVLTFFTSNVLYAAGVEAGAIVESVHYFSFSLIEYLLFVAILSAVIFILSPKVLYKEIHTTKAYIWASLLGLAIVVIIYFIMMAIMNTLFTDPESVKESYEILVGSVGFGYIGFAILIILNRSKAKGVNNNG